MTIINAPHVVAQLEPLVAEYERALAENDLAVMSELFWATTRTIRYDPSGEQHGHEAIDAWRQTRVPPGGRTIIRTELTTFDDVTAIATIEFTRDGSGGVGRQMQTWVRISGVGWRVVAAHVSVRDATP